MLITTVSVPEPVGPALYRYTPPAIVVGEYDQKKGRSFYTEPSRLHILSLSIYSDYIEF